MFHAEGKAGFNFGYIEGFADGSAGIEGSEASASGRARVRVHPPDSEWARRLNPYNYDLKYAKGDNWKGLAKHLYYTGPETEAPKTLTNKRVYGGHSSHRSISSGRNMYGFRRGYRRRVFRRRAVYRRRRFY